MEQPKNAKLKDQETEQPVIYVVDDEPMLLELAIAVLEPLGYAVKTFRDPKLAIRTFANARRPPALLITDYAMHNMNGMEVIAACRNLQPRQKILLLSGTVDEQIYENAPTKPDMFLSKPYQAKHLIEAVKTLIPRYSS